MITKNMELQKQKKREKRVFFEKEKFIRDLERSTGCSIYLRCVEDTIEFDENYGKYVNKELWSLEILSRHLTMTDVEYIAYKISDFLDAELIDTTEMEHDTHNYVCLTFYYEDVAR